MCGIAGIVDLNRALAIAQYERRLAAMQQSIVHRGPDDGGSYVDASLGVGLGFRRLAIIDLSEAGHQPMTTPDGRYAIVFNGEIYNHRELRSRLERQGVSFRGRSDTEVLLHAIAQWGIDHALTTANGMFALAVVDRRAQLLCLARDRFGEKPLYVARRGRQIAFASELKALRAQGWSFALDRDALSSYLRHGYFTGRRTVYEGVERIAPGSYERIDLRDGTSSATAYWDIRAVADSSVRALSVDEAVDELESLLETAVSLRMEADVPLGAFLSGGIDSSTVVALMQRLSTRPIKTFTIGFEEHGFDEAGYARRIAQHLRTDHTELYVSAADCLDVVPKLASIYDEPFADPSAVPTYLLSRLARQSVTVALSGDGGDELFGGYDRYRWSRDAWARLSRLPRPVRHVGGRAVGLLPRRGIDRGLALLPARFNRVGGEAMTGERLRRLGELVSVRDEYELYHQIFSTWSRPDDIVVGASELPTVYGRALRPDALGSAQLGDQLAYLPDDILVKVDRASMAVSLEARVPLLDPSVAAWAWSLPSELKLAGESGKVVLRRLLARLVPTELFERPKMGFGIPIDLWLRGPLRGWAEDLLAPDRLRSQGVFAPARIRATWGEHVSGRRNRGYLLWNVLMFNAWLETTSGASAQASHRVDVVGSGRPTSILDERKT